MKLKLQLTALAVILSGGSLFAQDFIDPGFTGTTSYDQWGGFNSTSYPGYGGYGSTAAWPAPIGSNIGASGDATLNKVSGYGYPGTTAGANYIYSSLFGGQAANTNPAIAVGTFSITDTTPVAGLETVMFQIQVSSWTSIGNPFPSGSPYPLLSYNGGAQNLWSNNLALLYRGEFSNEYGTGITDVWAFQWDLRDIPEEITSFTFTWSVTNHAQQYQMRVDQGSEYVQAVPEPSTLGLFGLGAVGLAFLRRRARQA